ncbi:DUF3108 domain-containing protein [Dyella caseinilytica]|uniref:DUF3108 domain-containing protein n=1 Tax=Dyella caseinilytica TaxID=1849581 RepID=A0ABX7GRW1_9GAMM|nr:DUF3108 domain-containing protein [Dyella caseinilytica]QRN52728.1 DUF3108 domain-containing protein [Dyella caseinilytica]GGA08252.1 hypothetical protein GCM10011408_32010 [Dyella caseinilytica]
MRTLKLPSALLAGLSLALSSTAVLATPPTPFTATYQVSQAGESMGQATITLKSLGNGVYEYSNQTQGTSGLAAALGANSSDVSRFRWNNDAPETVTYKSKVNAFKVKQRAMQVNWTTKQVSVDDGKGPSTYAAQPGLIDRNVLSLAIGLALSKGSQSMTFPVGVKQQVEQQQFKVQGTEAVQVPAGSFHAERVARTDSDKHFEAWYVPKQFAVPVKLAQSDGGDLTFQLIHYSSP